MLEHAAFTAVLLMSRANAWYWTKNHHYFTSPVAQPYQRRALDIKLTALSCSGPLVHKQQCGGNLCSSHASSVLDAQIACKAYTAATANASHHVCHNQPVLLCRSAEQQVASQVPATSDDLHSCQQSSNKRPFETVICRRFRVAAASTCG